MAKTVTIRAHYPPGHVRAPWYLRGKTGVIERALGSYKNPEALAYGRRDETRSLYRVRFTMAELWGAGAERPNDTLDAEIYDHWLEWHDAP